MFFATLPSRSLLPAFLLTGLLLPLFTPSVSAVEKDEASDAATQREASSSADRFSRPSVDNGADSGRKKDLPPRRVPPKRKGEISFDTILFDMEKDAQFEPDMVTNEIKALENKVVKIRGFILPASVFQQVGIKQFVLVRDNQECCFGPGAALYDCIMVTMTGDNTATFSTRPVAVKGTFHVTDKYKYPDGKYMAIYEMKATEVE